jgi:hypothetical protein
MDYTTFLADYYNYYVYAFAGVALLFVASALVGLHIAFWDACPKSPIVFYLVLMSMILLSGMVLLGMISTLPRSF